MSRSHTRAEERLGGPARVFLLGFFLTNVGNGMYTIAAGQLLYHLTGSVTGYAIVVFSEFGFKLLFQGVVRFDAVPALRICLTSDTFRTLAVGAAAGLLWLRYDYAAIAVATLAINTVKPFYIAATFRLVTRMNSSAQLERYNSGFIAAKQGGYLLGVAAYGAVLGSVSPAVVVLLNAVTYACMIGVLLRLRAARLPGEEPAAAAGGASGWRATFQLAADRPVLWQALAASHDPLLLYLLSLFVLSASEKWFPGTASSLALLQGSLMAGTAISALIIRSAAGKSVRQEAVTWRRLAAAELLLVGGLWLARNIVLVCALLAALGVISALSASYHMSRLTRVGAGRPRSRVIGFQLLAVSAAMLICLPVYSALLDHYLTWSFALPLGICLIFAVLITVVARDGQAGGGLAASGQEAARAGGPLNAAGTLAGVRERRQA